MPALREVFAEFGIRFDRDRALQKGEKATEKATRGLGKLDKQSAKVSTSQRVMGRAVEEVSGIFRGFAAALGAAALVQGFRTMISDTIESTTTIARWADRLGMSEQALYSWSRVAARFGGDIDDVTDAFKELQIKTRDAMAGGGVAGDSWKMLGIDVRSLTPILNDQEALMERFIEGLNGVDEATRNFVIDDIMSDAGTRLTEMFAVGVPGLRAMRSEIDQLGGRQFPALAQQTRSYRAAAARLNETWTAARDALALHILPLLTAGAEKFRSMIGIVRALADSTTLLRTVIIAVGAAAAAAGLAAAVAWGPAIVTVLAVAAGVAVLALAVDDLVVFMDNSGDSVTQRLVEWAVGTERAAAGADKLRFAIRLLAEMFDWFFDSLRVVTQLGNIWAPLRSLLQGSTAPMDEAMNTLGERVTGLIRNNTGELDSVGELSPARQAELEVIRGQRQRARMQSRAEAETPMPWELDAAERAQMSIPARAPMERRPVVGPVGTGGGRPRVDVQAPMDVNVTVNEATDAATVRQQVETAVRSASDEQWSRISRDLSDLISDNEMTMVEGE